MSSVLYFDCFSGASGDMILGALIDAGLPFEELDAALGSLPIDGVTMHARRVDRAGIAATSFTVGGPGVEGGADDHHRHDHTHGHEHDGHHHHDQEHDHGHADPHDQAHGHADHHDQAHGHPHHHRGLTEICRIVDGSGLSSTVKERATVLFRRLAEVEAAIHQQPVEQVHLHEVGAIDSIVDIVGGVFALEWFGVDRVVSSSLNVGSGTVRCAHGVMPVPAPATARLIEGVPVYAAGPPVELLTPTGALLVTEYASAYGALPAMRVTRQGYGAGDRDLPGRPNVLRVLVGEEAEGASLERVVVIECEIDDMNPQLFGRLMERLQVAGARDVFYAPIQMKKNRPGTLVTVIAQPEQRGALTDLIFRETTTIGVRFHEVDRECLRREAVDVATAFGPVRVKRAWRGGAVLNAAPEYEDCVRQADSHGVPVKDVQAAALKAYLDRPPDGPSADPAGGE